MGSFNDFRNTSRDSWKYTYTGKELLPYAQKKLDFYVRREMEVRTLLSRRLADPGIKGTSDKNEALRTKMTTFGTEREKCLVWVHEFTRNPDTSYTLSLGDVTYFDIASIPVAEGEDPDDDNT